MMTPTRPGSRSDWTRPCQQAYAKAGNSGQAGRLHSSSRHSLCYPSPPTQATPRTALSRCFFPAVNSSPVFPNADSDCLRLILVSPRNPLNIGTAARAMSNFGFLHLRVVNVYELAFREARSAVGAAPLLARAEECKTLAEAVADCTLVVGTTAVGLRQLQHPVRRLDQAAPLIRKRLAASPVALLFGSEKRGLSNEDLSHCHWLLRIPTREEHRSMNLAQAVAIVVYEISRTTAKLTAKNRLPRAAADMETINRINAALLEALHASGYIHRRSAATAEEKLRRMLRRFELSSGDAEVLLGMLRKVLWKIKSQK